MDRAPFKLATDVLVFLGGEVYFELTFEECYILAPSMSTKSAPRAPSLAGRRRFCVIFPGALGDFICCLPVLNTLAGEGEVDVFARSEFAAIASEGLTVHSLERPEIAKLFTPQGAAGEQVRRLFSAYAAIYSWMGSGQVEFVGQLQAASAQPVRIFPFRPAEPHLHQADYYYSCLYGDRARAPEPRLGSSLQTSPWLDQFRARHGLVGRALLVVAPGSGAREKNWPADRFALVADWWRVRLKGAVVFLIGPVEEERGLSPSLQNAGVVARHLDLAQSAALLASADLYIGNDSGITHLAAAAGIRTVAIFGPSSPIRWAPRGARVTLITRNEACSPCGVAEMKGCAHRRCLVDIDADSVIAVLASLPEVSTLTR
jgi:ADP-heptose:LPS heptosyltransferase